MIKTWKDDTFKNDFVYCISETAENIYGHIKKHKHKMDITLDRLKELCANASGFCICKDSVFYLIIVKPRSGTIAHECFHITYHSLSSIDTPLTDDTEEIYAYYLDKHVQNVFGMWIKLEEPS